MRSPEERAREVIEAHTGMPYKAWMSGGPGYKPNSWEALSDKIAAAIREAVEAEREAAQDILLRHEAEARSKFPAVLDAAQSDAMACWGRAALDLRARQQGEG